MTNNNDSSKVKIAELNSEEKRNVHFSLESNNTKPYDINKMTGKPANNSNSSQE